MTKANDTITSATDRETSDFHRLRSNPQRRAVLEVLQNTSGDITVTELAERVSAIHSPEGSIEETEIRLYHVHLPMLSEAGLLTYDWTAREVTPLDSRNDLLTGS